MAPHELSPHDRHQWDDCSLGGAILSLKLN